MAAKMGARGLKMLEFVFDVVYGVYRYVILVVESEFEVQNCLRLKGMPKIQYGRQNFHDRVKSPKVA